MGTLNALIIPSDRDVACGIWTTNNSSRPPKLHVVEIARFIYTGGVETRRGVG